MAEWGRFQPRELLRVLEEHQVRYVLIGGFAATLHGSPIATGDADICPARDRQNLERLAAGLTDLDARIRTGDAPQGLPFSRSAEFLERTEILNLATRFGELDVAFRPSGTAGYDDLVGGVVTYDLGGLRVPVASLLDVIRSKQAANRDRDRAALPTLRKLLELSRIDTPRQL